MLLCILTFNFLWQISKQIYPKVAYSVILGGEPLKVWDILTIKTQLMFVYTYILYIKMLELFLCLSELIEELGSHRDVKIGM